ncbi:MAG: tyrosine protein phosphatase [bacterium]|nr:tyrosine protein phosphatase [bacterium]
MIDIHAHILPGLDDGPSTLEESLEMARIAVKNKIQVMVATPHCLNGRHVNWRKDILAACAEFNSELATHGIPLKVLPGSEIHLSTEIPDEIQNGRLMTLNDTGHYFFLELPDQIIPDSVMRFIYSMRSRNITPIIAHPERNMAIQSNSAMVENFLSAGALCQITGSSLRGEFGPRVFDCCSALLTRRMVHFVASDAHSASGRPPDLLKSYKKLSSLIGKKNAENMMVELPQKILLTKRLININS